MGQKVNPIGIRLGFTKKSNSFWYPDGNTFSNILKTDLLIREYIMNKFSRSAGVSKIFIERVGRNVKIAISAIKPGMIIGKKGEDIENLRLRLSEMFNISIVINVEEIKKPDLDAYLVSVNVASQLKKRITFRRAMKLAIESVMKQGAKGVKISISGRLNGADIARREWSKEGRIPLHTFRADIDYGFSESKTTYGVIGVKVWIYKGDALNKINEVF